MLDCDWSSDVCSSDLQQHLLVMARDITEQRLALDALVAARDAAEDAARTKAAFLANMSHEIRTPMNAIIGLSRLTLDDALPDQARLYVDKLHASAVALMGILDDVLDYSKIEAGQLRFEQLPLDLGELLQRVEGLFIARIEQKGLALRSTLGPGVPQRVSDDPLRLSQVLNNLVGNAVKFTEHGQIEVAVALEEPVSQQGVLLRFEVSDSGIGIAPQQQSALFEAFAQGDSSITRRFGGSGLGLAICKRLVGMMGGRIGVASTPGAGSRFWFTARLALADDQAPAAPAPAMRRVGSPTPAALPQGLRILVVEDNELNQIVATQFLRRMGAEVELATDGAQAVSRVQQAGPGHYAAVLMDLHMPVLDGLEATRRIHALPEHSSLPVIGMTAAAMPEDRANCLAAGMLSHVPKPVIPERLLQAIRQALPGVLGGAAPPAVGVAEPLAPVPIAEPPIDLAALRQRLSHNEGLLKRLLELFGQREAQVVDELADSLARGDLQAAKLRAHDLKGSAATLCAMPASRAAAALETALKQGESPGPALGRLAEAMGEVLAQLAAMRSAPPG
jgi:signal transduction histidine kinase/CheY-like chemotaxis protein/HPt (histidine-containing phosphotransfer) domain-containing protein